MNVFKVNTFDEIIEAQYKAESNDIIEIQPGVYNLTKPMVFDGLYTHGKPLTVRALPGVEINGGGKPRALDIRGKNIVWDGGELYGGNNTVVDLRGHDIEFKNADVHGGKTQFKTNQGIGIIGTNNKIHGCKIHDFGNIGIDGNGGEIGDNWQVIRGKYRGTQNWHIYDNEIYNISYNSFGFHEGAMKLVPWCRDIFIYANYVHDCDGQGIWLDRPEGNVVIWGNRVERVGGKSIFYEISDEWNGNDHYGCVIAMNDIREGKKHGIFVSSSSYCDVFGNTVEAWLPIVVHGMPREIDKVNNVPGTGTMWKLKHNVVHHNVLKNTYHRSHLAVYDYDTKGNPLASNNTFHNNYYVTGHTVVFNGKPWKINVPTLALGPSKGLNHVTHEGTAYTNDGITGPWIEGLPDRWLIPAVAENKSRFPFLYKWNADKPIDPVIPQAVDNSKWLTPPSIDHLKVNTTSNPKPGDVISISNQKDFINIKGTSTKPIYILFEGKVNDKVDIIGCEWVYFKGLTVDDILNISQTQDCIFVDTIINNDQKNSLKIWGSRENANARLRFYNTTINGYGTDGVSLHADNDKQDNGESFLFVDTKVNQGNASKEQSFDFTSGSNIYLFNGEGKGLNIGHGVSDILVDGFDGNNSKITIKNTDGYIALGNLSEVNEVELGVQKNPRHTEKPNGSLGKYITYNLEIDEPDLVDNNTASQGTIVSDYKADIKVTGFNEWPEVKNQGEEPTIVPPISNLRFDNATPISFEIYFDHNYTNYTYEVWFNDEVLISDKTELILLTLSPDTQYKIKIRAVDSEGNKSQFVEGQYATLKKDTTPPTTPSGEKPVWIFTDYSSVTDPDDFCSMSALLLTAKDRVNIKGITVGCHNLKDEKDPVQLYNSKHGQAFLKEKDNIGYDYTPKVYKADNWQTRSRFGSNVGSSVMAAVNEIKKYSKEAPLRLASWGIHNELYALVDYILTNEPQLVENFIIYSHFTANASDNNCFKDAEACSKLHQYARQGKIRFAELGGSGARDTIDDRNAATGEMSPDVMKSAIGKFFGEKWIEHSTAQPGRPDFSDFISIVVLAFPEIMGEDFESKLKLDGSDNKKLITSTFREKREYKGQVLNGKRILYAIIEEAAEKARKGGGVDPDPVRPSAPKNLRSVRVTKSSVELMWDKVAGARYVIETLLDNSVISSFEDVGENHDIVGLDSDTEYTFRVSAIKDGLKSPRITIKVRTLEGDNPVQNTTLIREYISKIRTYLDEIEKELI